MSFRLISYINEVTVLFSIFCIRSVTSGLNKYFGKNNYSKKKKQTYPTVLPSLCGFFTAYAFLFLIITDPNLNCLASATNHGSQPVF